jgi:hypothetical protein
MADFLEDFDFYNINEINGTNNINGINNINGTNNIIALQMIELAEKEDFNHLELTDVKFKDGIIFNRVQRLNKLQKIKIVNTNITTLANLPLNINELIIKKGDIYIANFKLTSQLIKNITIINNKLNKIFYLNTLSYLVFLDLSQNDLTEIPSLPENLLTFIATHNKIKEITNLNSKLVDLNLSNNLLSEMCNIPHSIEFINISRNMIKLIDLSPFIKLKVFKAYNNKIELIIGPISSYIEVFDVFNNELEKIPDIGLEIKEIDLSNNDLKILPKFGTKLLKSIDITKNPLLKLSDDEIQMLMTINKLNNSLIVISDHFDMPNNDNDNDNDILLSSSSSEIDLSEIFNNTDEKIPVKQFDIIELLNRNKNQQINQQIIIRGKQIYKRRLYEL